MIVVEWDWESFDEATARWCLERLGAPDREGWLHYLQTWAVKHSIHTGQALLRELDQRFQRHFCRRGPYFFGDLAETSEEDGADAIVAGQIQATRVDYVGSLL